MEDNRKLSRVFDRVKLSQSREEAILADLLSEKREVLSMKQTDRRRIPAAALVVAVLVAVLAGTALAREYFGRVDVLPVNGDYKNGYKVHSAFQSILSEHLSEEALEYAARKNSDTEDLVFGSWSEAEEFLGLEIADNPMLEEMAQSEWIPLHECDLTPEDSRDCTVRMGCHRGVPNIIEVHADYFGDYFEEGPFGVTVFAYVRVKAAEDQEDIPFSISSGDAEIVSEEKYVTPKGIEATIITRIGTGTLFQDGTTYRQASYFAYFSYHNAVFQLITNFNEENADASLNLLKEILDAYE